MCENLHYESVYVYFKELHNDQAKNTIDRQYTKRGKLQCQVLLIIGFTGPPTIHFKFITEVRQLTIILLQSATSVITKCESY